jgi:hypothetical protein
MTEEGVEDKGIAAFAILSSKGLTIAALLDKEFLSIPSKDKPTPYITAEPPYDNI